MTKAILTMLIGAAIGGAIGYSKVLCLTGECALTGSWQGGAVIGGAIGLALVGCPCSRGACASRRGDGPTGGDDANASPPQVAQDPDERNPYRSA